MARSTRYAVLLAGLLLAALVPVVAGSPARAGTAPVPAAPVVRRPPAARTLDVVAPVVSPRRPVLGQRYVVSGRMPGHVRRPVVVIVDGTRRGWSHTTRRGDYRFVLRAPRRVTTLRVKVRAPRLRRHRAALTGVRLVPVVIRVQPCTALPAGTTVWAADSKRIVNCQVTVPVGATLKVGAGATVLFGPGAGILVKGSLVVAGTADHPTRLVRRTTGRWAGVATTGDASLDVTHAVITGAQIAVDGESTVPDPHGHVRVSHSRISNGGTGVLVQSSSSTVYTLTASVTDSEFAGLERGVWIEGATSPTVARNSFHGLSGVPVTVTWTVIDFDLVVGNTGYANAENIWESHSNVIFEDGTLAGGLADQRPATATMPRPLMPVLSAGGLVALDNTTVTITSGVVKVAGEDAIGTRGTIRVRGTATSPVVLTSVSDDGVGDSVAVGSPAGGEWAGFETWGDVASLDIQHLDMRHAMFVYLGGPTPAASISISDSTFSHVDGGIQSGAASVSVERSVFVGPFVGLDVSGATHPVIRDNSFNGQVNAPIYISSSTVDPDDLAGNQATDSAARMLAADNVTIDADGAWPMGPAAWNPAGSPPGAGEAVPLTVLVDSVTIAPGVTVAFGTGAVKFASGGQLEVAGTATLLGTNTQPTVLTSETDDHVGVPISSGATASTGLVSVDAGGTVTADNAVFRNTGTALSLAAGAAATFDNVEFANTTTAIDAAATPGCPNPFGTTSVTGNDVWFGASGGPGGLSALSTSTDQLSPTPTQDEIDQHTAAKAAYDDAVSRYGSLDAAVTDNTIPFVSWACYQFSFPVTPVHVGVAATAPFPDYAQSGG